VYSNLGQETFASEHLSRAFELRERASEREKYTISASYYSIVTGDLDKAREACELWNQSYPGDDVALGILGNNYMLEGLWEKALSPTLESLRANPNDVLTYSNLAQNYIALNSQKEAKAAIDQALARNLDYWGLHLFMYYYAFLRGDTAEMNRQLAWGAVDPGEAGLLPSAPADTEGYYGRLHKARQISRRAMESALHTGAKETASILAANDAVREAEFGNADQARERGIAVLEMAPKSGAVKPLAALALARAGNVARAAAIADQLASDNPSSTIQNSYWIPAIRAAIALQRHYPSLAVELLQPTVAYELAYSDPLQVGVMYPAFLRGQAYLDLHQGNQAAAEFQKFFDHRGVILNYPLAALARLGLARAYAMQGNAAMAKSTYQDFLTLWKDADPDIPIYKAAKAEYEKVQ